MDTSIAKTTTKEQHELNKRLKELHQLETELAQQELDLATMRAELHAIDLLYLRKVGARLAHLEVIDARIAELLARLNPEDENAEQEAEKQRKKAAEASQEAGSAEAVPEESTQFKPSEKLKALYREAAKRVHPDMALDEDDRNNRTRWMIEVNAAYQSGDEERLVSLLEEWENSPESVQGSDVQADLERTIRKIVQAQERMLIIQQDFERLKKSFAYSLRQRIEVARKQGRDLLKEMSDRIEKLISRKQSLLDDMVKNAIHPEWIDW